MNEAMIGSFLQAGIWCVIQITILMFIAMLVLWPLSWLRRPVGSGPALSAIAMVGVLTVLCFAPLPGWWNSLAQAEVSIANAEDIREAAPSAESASEVAHSASDSGAGTDIKKLAPADSDIDWSEVFIKAMSATHVDATQDPGWLSWRAGGVLILCGSLFLGGISLAASLLGLWKLRRSSVPVARGELQEQLDILQARAGYTRRIELRESKLIGGPATFGHFAPVILLPACWRTWTEAQLSAVIAHELAHIQRSDYVSHLLSQLCLAVHFYHPLMHALVSRLRLDQELAADALAAGWSGPRENYLRALAEVALALPPRSSGLAVRSFVPSRGAWVRRIEMLKTMRGDGVGRRGWSLAWLGLMGLVALGVSSVRSPRGMTIAQEGAGQKSAASSASGGDYLTKYAAQNAEVVVAIRPGQILAHPAAKVFETWGDARGPFAEAKRAGIDLAKVEQVVLSGPLAQGGPRPQGVAVVRYAEADKLASLLPKEKPLGEVGGVSLFEVDGFAWGSIDAKTIVLGSAVDVTKSLSSQRGAAILERKAWNAVKASPFAIVLKSEAIRGAMKIPEGAVGGTPQGAFHMEMKPILGLAAPVWEDTDVIAMQVEMNGELKATVRTESQSESQAKEVAQTASALSTLARNFLRSQLETNKEMAPFQIVLAELARDTLATMKSTTEGGAAQVTLTVADKDKIASMLPAFVASARAEAQRVSSMNNMKQILLALHNYHDTYGRMPAAIQYGPDGKTPHSWRVAILPFIEQSELHRQYKFDEPWDSENNKKVLAKIPAIYQDPSEKGKSTNTSYFAIAGVKTILNLGAAGAGLADITDGTSNTIAVVDAKKETPWTKPEDLDVDTPAAKLGYKDDQFLAGFGDGSVRMITKKIDPTMLKWLFLRDDGNVVIIP